MNPVVSPDRPQFYIVREEVLSDYRRKHVGSLLVREALQYYRSAGFKHMYIIRDLPVNWLREEDSVALQFYASTGAFPLREYVRFQSD